MVTVSPSPKRQLMTILWPCLVLTMRGADAIAVLRVI
jgi:hypothetical protein